MPDAFGHAVPTVSAVVPLSTEPRREDVDFRTTRHPSSSIRLADSAEAPRQRDDIFAVSHKVSFGADSEMVDSLNACSM